MSLATVFVDLASGAPADNELWIRPRDASDRSRRDLATLVVEAGIDGFDRGSGAVTTVCVGTSPTLDDMLAASFVGILMDGDELPASAADLARYAALVREGLHPGKVSLEDSLEGSYLAVRNGAGRDLGDRQTARSFVSSWQRMFAVLRDRAESGSDVFADALFADEPSFARERTFLRDDHKVFEQDVQRGETLEVRIPDGPPSGWLLILRQPKSLLFKSWSREPGEAPDGQPFSLLAVRSAADQWVLSTDPVMRLSLHGLFENLQAAEVATGKASDDDPWFDGAPFAHTLIAAPRAGTRLSESQVLAIVRKWTGARRRSKGGLGLRPVAGLAAAAVIGSVLFLGYRFGAQRSSPAIDFRTRGSALDQKAITDLHSEGVRIPGYALLIGVGNGQGDYPALEGAVPGAASVYAMLRDRYGVTPENIRFLADRPEQAVDDRGQTVPVSGPPTQDGVLDAIRSLGDEMLRYPDGDRTNFFFYYGGHGHKEKRARAIGHLVLEGFDTERPDVTGLGMTQLSQFLQERIASSHQILIMDTCFSGFTVVARGVGDRDEDASRIFQLWQKRAHVIITAGTRDQQALEFAGRSIFTDMLLDGIGEGLLADSNQDRIVTDAELGTFLTTEVPSAVEFASGGSLKLTPQYHRGLQGDDVGQFLFVPHT